MMFVLSSWSPSRFVVKTICSWFFVCFVACSSVLLSGYINVKIQIIVGILTFWQENFNIRKF